MAFHTTSPISVTEELFDRNKPSNRNFVKEKQIRDKQGVAEVYKILNDACNKTPVKLEDCDVRVSIYFHGISGKYYLCSDKKHISFKGIIFPVSNDMMERLVEVLQLCR